MDENKPPQSSRAELIWVLGLSGGAVTFSVAMVGWRWAGSERADFAQWLMAGAAVATLLAAIGAAVFAAGAFSLESDRENRFQDSQRRFQAERVAAWHGHEEPARDPHLKSLRPPTPHDVVRMRNASDLPVTHVTCVLKLATTKVGTVNLTILPPSDTPMVVPLNSRLTRKLHDVTLQFRAAHASGTPIPAPTIDIEFTDAAGRRWSRAFSGTLLEL